MNAATLAFSRGNARNRSMVLDTVLLSAVIGLLLLGLVMVTSASITVAGTKLGDPFYYLKAQSVGLGLGVMAAAVVCVVPTALWEKLAMPLMLFALLILVLVAIPGVGHQVNGSRRWLRLGFMNFQPSELSRLLLLMYLASYIARRQAELRESLQGFVKPLGLMALAATLLLLEPDMGAATVLLATGMGMLFLAGVKLRHFFALLGIGGVLFGLLIVVSPYRMERLLHFSDPWKDPFGSGFQLAQSLIAIGRGEWFGVGLGASVQKLFYLPEAHTDFVFAVMAEELGLVGIVTMLALIVVAVVRVLATARLAANAGMVYQAFVAASFGIWMALQTFVNVGVNMGLLPTKGLTLPFLSYGKSSILVTLVWLALVMRIHHEASLSGRSALPRAGGAKERDA
jgi:cell division protein FtsW